MHDEKKGIYAYVDPLTSDLVFIGINEDKQCWKLGQRFLCADIIYRVLGE